MKKQLSSILTILLTASASFGSVLSTTAENMAPNSWQELSTNDFQGGAILTRCVHSMLAFNNELKWDSAGRQLYILGSGHGDWASGNCIGFVRYDEASNAWTTLPKPPFYGEIHHGWDHTAFDQANRTFYHKTSMTEKTYRYPVSTGQWTEIAGPFDVSTDSRYGALEFFPGLNCLFWYREPYLLDLATNKWEALPFSFQSKTPAGEWTYQEFAEYDPNHALMLFGGGNGARHLFKMDAAKRITHLKDSPFGLGINHSIEFTDTRSGRLIVYREDATNEMWSYDVIADAWEQIPGKAPFLTNYGDWMNMVGGWISTYGVGFFVQWNGSNSKIYLYKPPAGTTAVPRPGGIAGRGWKPAADQGPVMIYDLSGRLVPNPSNLRTGVYVTKSGRACFKKILVLR